MRNLSRGMLLTAILTCLGLIAILPAHAGHAGSGSATATDSAGVSGVDPLNDAVPDQSTVGTKANALGKTTKGQADIHAYTFKRITLPSGASGLETSWTLKDPLPAEGIQVPSGDVGTGEFNSMFLVTAFRNPDVLDNRQTPVCERTTSTAIRKTYVYAGYFGHYLDGHMLFVGFAFNYTGGKYAGEPIMGYFDPSADGDFIFYSVRGNSVLNPSGAGSGKGTYYDYTYSSDRRTITVKVPGILPQEDVNCKTTPPDVHGTAYYPFARTQSQKAADPFYTVSRGSGSEPGQGNDENDMLLHVNVRSFLSQAIVSPVVIPLSLIDEDDIETIASIDWGADNMTLSGVDQWSPGIGRKGLLTGDAPGPTCWTPTFGGTLPSNPIHNAGGQCAIDNPIGPEYLLTGLNFRY